MLHCISLQNTLHLQVLCDTEMCHLQYLWFFNSVADGIVQLGDNLISWSNRSKILSAFMTSNPYLSVSFLGSWQMGMKSADIIWGPIYAWRSLCRYISSIIKFPFNKKIYKEVNFLVVVDVIKLFSNNLFPNRHVHLH